MKATALEVGNVILNELKWNNNNTKENKNKNTININGKFEARKKIEADGRTKNESEQINSKLAYKYLSQENKYYKIRYYSLLKNFKKSEMGENDNNNKWNETSSTESDTMARMSNAAADRSSSPSLYSNSDFSTQSRLSQKTKIDWDGNVCAVVFAILWFDFFFCCFGKKEK